MSIFSSGPFTSTPIDEQQDLGFYENSPQSRNSSQTSDAIESSYLPLRKNLFGKRSISENVPDCPSRKCKVLISKSSCRDLGSNEETPRTSRICAGSIKSVHLEEIKVPRQPPKWPRNPNTSPLKQLCNNDSGFWEETPERLCNSKSDCYGIPLLPLVENLQQVNEGSREESLAYFKHFLNASGAKNCDVSRSEMIDLYFIYRFQRTGLKPSATDLAFYEKYLEMEDMDKESERFLSSWKDQLESLSSNLNRQPKIDFLSIFSKMNAYLILSNIFSCLSGYDLQNVSCVSRLWRKLVLEDKGANRKRLSYLIERQKSRKEMDKKKLTNLFPRLQNFRILGCNQDNKKSDLHLKRAIKDINFDAFIEVGKSDDKHKPMKCPSCAKLSLQNKKIITKYNCLFCGFEFCCNCLKPYKNWHFCASTYLPAKKPHTNGKKYLRRL